MSGNYGFMCVKPIETNALVTNLKFNNWGHGVATNIFIIPIMNSDKHRNGILKESIRDKSYHITKVCIPTIPVQTPEFLNIPKLKETRFVIFYSDIYGSIYSSVYSLLVENNGKCSIINYYNDKTTKYYELIQSLDYDYKSLKQKYIDMFY